MLRGLMLALMCCVLGLGLYYTVTGGASVSYMELHHGQDGVHGYSGWMFLVLAGLLALFWAGMEKEFKKW